MWWVAAWLNRAMDVNDLLLDLYGRVPPLAHRAASGSDAAQLCRVPAEGTNSIGWLVWHLARVQDHQLGEVFEREQVWVDGDWAQGFGLEPDPSNLGYGHSAADVATVRPESDVALLGYLDAVAATTTALLEPLTPTDLDRIVDEKYDPPVTLGVRLISVADDCLQHVGQANYLRGMFGGS